MGRVMMQIEKKLRRGKRGIFAFLLLVTIMISNAIFAATIVGTGRAENRNGELLIVFPLSQQIKFNSFRLQNPERLVVDIPNAQLQKKVTSLPITSAFVGGVRLVTQQGTYLHVVIDLRQGYLLVRVSVVKLLVWYDDVLAF